VSESTPAAVDSKLCTKCKQVKPVETFGRNKKGLLSWCRECYAEHARRYRASPEGRERVRASQRSNYLRNREKRIAQAVEYQKRNPVDPELRRQRGRAWYTANRERAEVVKRAWRESNAELVAETRRRAMSRRRARLRGLPSESYTMDQILERDGNACVLCGRVLNLAVQHPHPMSPTVEHLECIAWPDSAGDVLTNVAVSHYRCNNDRRASPHPAAARKRAELLAVTG
jgi:hypothetical protein